MTVIRASREVTGYLSTWVHKAQKIMYGLTGYEIVLCAVRLRAGMEHLFMLVTVGDLIGLPVLPPYYSLRLLPYLVPQISTWKRQILRQRDFIEADGIDLLA